MIKKVLLAVGSAIVGAGLTVLANNLRKQKAEAEEIMAVETTVREKPVIKTTKPVIATEK